MAQIREIKKRMGAVKTIQRITKTMQMIATAKFTHALQRAKQTRPYTEKVTQLVREVAAAAGSVSHPLIDGPTESPNRHLVLVLASDRGLCGAYNGNVLRTAMHFIRDLQNRGIDVDVQTAGKKAVGFFRFQKVAIDERHQFGDSPTYDQIERLARSYIDAFTAGKYDAITVVGMRFISNARQVPNVNQLMPLKPEAADEAPAEAHASAVYEFSPSAQELLADLLPMTVKTSLFMAFNDAIVSEHIMRMIAMKAATENAGDLSRNLRRDFNRARQTAITTELMEVISGAAALD